MNISNKMKEIRAITGLTRKDFSDKYGIPLRTLEEWEAGRRIPPEYVIRMLAYYVGVSAIVEQADGNTSEEIKNSRNVNIIRDIENRKIVFIHDIIFKNKQNIKWDEVEQYLEQYINEFYTIAEDGEKIYIGRDLPDEYAHSQYTARLKGSAAKAKANAVQAVPELIQISENGSYIENKNQKHNLDAKYGWYRYDSRFAIAIYNNDNEVERYNVYKVRMIIRYDADGKKYLYDMINIKKEPSTPLG